MRTQKEIEKALGEINAICDLYISRKEAEGSTLGIDYSALTESQREESMDTIDEFLRERIFTRDPGFAEVYRGVLMLGKQAALAWVLGYDIELFDSP